MRVLLKKTDDSMCCMELTKASYDTEARELSLENMEEVVVIPGIPAENANAIVQTLYTEGMADLTGYHADC